MPASPRQMEVTSGIRIVWRISANKCGGLSNRLGLIDGHYWIAKRSLPSCAKLFRKFREACDDDIVPRIRLRIGWPFRAPFVGSAHEGCPVAAGFGGIEIEIVAGDHSTFAGIELKVPGAGLVGFRQDLVFADRLAGDDGIPGKARFAWRCP